MLDGQRTCFFDCNKPGTKGYFAAVSGFHVSKLYAHVADGETPFDEDLDNTLENMMWLYMLVDKNEYLQGLWAVRHSKGIVQDLTVSWF